LHIVGNNTTPGTMLLVPDAAKGNNTSHIHYEATGYWFIRSAVNGKVIIQDQDPNAFIGIGTPFTAMPPVLARDIAAVVYTNISI
jgi:hypothetical protein